MSLSRRALVLFLVYLTPGCTHAPVAQGREITQEERERLELLSDPYFLSRTLSDQMSRLGSRPPPRIRFAFASEYDRFCDEEGNILNAEAANQLIHDPDLLERLYGDVL